METETEGTYAGIYVHAGCVIWQNAGSLAAAHYDRSEAQLRGLAQGLQAAELFGFGRLTIELSSRLLLDQAR